MNRTVVLIGLFAFCAALLVPPFEAVNIPAEMANDLIRIEGVPYRPVEPDLTFAVIFAGPVDSTWRDARIAGDVWTAILVGIAGLTLGIGYLTAHRQ